MSIENTRQLIVLQNKLQLTYDLSLNVAKIKEQIVLAHSSSKKCQRITESLSLEYQTQFTMAKEEAGEIKATVFISNDNHIEAQRILFRNIQHLQGKSKGSSASKVTVTEGNGKTKEYTDDTTI